MNHHEKWWLCERCGGTGKQEAGLWTGTAYDSKAGQCDECKGLGYLGDVTLKGLFGEIPEWMFGDSVYARNALHNCGRFHAMTCGNDRMDTAHRLHQEIHGGDFGQLIAVEEGAIRWRCPVCGYTQ